MMNMIGRKALLLSLFHWWLVSSSVINHGFTYDDATWEMESIKAPFLERTIISPSPSSNAPSGLPSSRDFLVSGYGADPTGERDSTEAILRAISDAFSSRGEGDLMPGIPNLGGARVYLEGGAYKISRPLRLPSTGGGNFMIHGGSLFASDDFPADRHLIELWPLSSLSSFASSYEDITLKDLYLDSNFRGGGISVINSLRTTISNCYICHFTTDGILVQGGHETLIRSSFIGQHITAGGDPGEKNFSGIGINLVGNDNIITDVVIFSAAVGIMVAGQANILTRVHCYNKATGWGGTGIYVRLPGLTQTRILNCYLDYTGIVVEDPVQLLISGSFFLGDAYIKLKSIKGVITGLSITDNMFSGSEGGVDIVQLDEMNGAFATVEQVVVDRNNVMGMTLKSTVGRRSLIGNGTTWTIDFSDVLLFPDLIKHAQYTVYMSGGSSPFVNHALRNTSGNKVVVETESSVTGTLYVTVDQNTMTT